ncbi:MAG: hypothetical protein KC503_25875 [Myxococcales bacterium]|nr:hypothetical protein [Myxococcales bacterium]
MKHKPDAERQPSLHSARYLGVVLLALEAVSTVSWLTRLALLKSLPLAGWLTVLQVSGGFVSAASLMFILGLARYRRDAAPSLGNATLASLAFWTAGASWLLYGSYGLVDLLPRGASTVVVSLIGILTAAAEIVASVALLLTLLQGQRAAGAPPTAASRIAPAVLLQSVFYLAMSLLRAFGVRFYRATWYAVARHVVRAVNIAGTVALGLWWLSHARHAAAAGDKGASWQLRSGSALDSLRGALVTRLVILIAGVVLALLAGLARSAPMLKAVTLLVPVASIVATLLVLAAVGRFALTPRPIGGSGLAIAALALFAVAAAGEVSQLRVVSSIAGHSFYTAARLMREANIYTTVVQLASLVGVALLLSSLQQIAARTASQLLADKASHTRTLVIITALAAVGLRVLAVSRVVRSAGLLLIAGGATLVLAIIAFVMMLRLLEQLAAALRDARDEGAPRKLEADDGEA